TGIPLGLIPGGTGNLLAGNLRLPPGALRATQAMVAGLPRPVDLGRVPRPDGDLYFAVACGAGIDARVMVETVSEQKHRWGMMAYVATTLRILPEVRNIPFVVEVDGTRHEVEAALLMIANCGEVIPRVVKMGSGISPHDGVLDLVAVRADSFGSSV